jgi:hypothetical protein
MYDRCSRTCCRVCASQHAARGCLCMPGILYKFCTAWHGAHCSFQQYPMPDCCSVSVPAPVWLTANSTTLCMYSSPHTHPPSLACPGAGSCRTVSS